MIFRLCTSGYFYPYKPQRDKLEKLGFSFKPSEYKDFSIDGSPTVEIKTVEELVEFAKEHGSIIISDVGPQIEIYNDYQE